MGLVTNMWVPSPIHEGDALDNVYGYYDGSEAVQNIVWTLRYGEGFASSYVMATGEATPGTLHIPSAVAVGSTDIYGACRILLDWEQDSSGGYGPTWNPWQFGTNDFVIEEPGSEPVELSADGASTSDGSADLFLAIDMQAAGASVSGGNARLSSDLLLSAAGASQSSGAAVLSFSLLVAASGSSTSDGGAALSFSLALMADGMTASGGAAMLRNFIAFAASGASQSTGQASFFSNAPPVEFYHIEAGQVFVPGIDIGIVLP